MRTVGFIGGLKSQTSSNLNPCKIIKHNSILVTKKNVQKFVWTYLLLYLLTT